jgi:hypothetical protein
LVLLIWLPQACRGVCNETVWKKRLEGREGGDAQEEARHAQEWQWQEGESRKQAIAIGLSEARRKGKKVPRKKK